MAFAFGGAGALLKAFIPALPGLTARRGFASGARRRIGRDRAPAPAPVPIAALSAEAEAALAPLGLPPDGPIDPNAVQRARLAPDVAARNFVRWAQALDLDGDYATRGVYALYCEFSEVDGRPPLRDSRFLEALARTQGITAIQRGKDKACRLWRWTIAPAKPIEVVAEAIAPDVWTHLSAPAPDRAPGKTASPTSDDPAGKVTAAQALAADVRTSAPAAAIPAARADGVPPLTAPAPSRVAQATASAATQPMTPDVPPAKPAPAPALASARAPAPTPPRAPETHASAGASPAAKAIRSAIVLPRYVPDTEHPFSPAGLREREKCARRLRLNAAASRKQRGALRRAA